MYHGGIMEEGATVLDRAEATSTERERGLIRGCAWVVLGLCSGMK